MIEVLVMVLTVFCDNKFQLGYLCLPRCNSEVYRIHSQIIHGGGLTNKDLKEVWKLSYCNRKASIINWVSISHPVIMLISSGCPCFNDQLLRRVEDNDLRGDPLQGIGDTYEMQTDSFLCMHGHTCTRISYMASPYTLKELSAS